MKNTSVYNMFDGVAPTAMIKFVGSAIVFVLLASGSNSQEEECVTTSNQSGTCINIQHCPALRNLLQGRRPTQQSLELLKSSNCGYDGRWPKVCCQNEEATTTAPIITKGSDEDPVIPSSPPDVTSHTNLRLLNHALCGPITQTKIVGGNKTGVFDYPWMALIAYKTGGSIEFRCGGTIINKRYVLTAAHCVTQLPTDLTLFGVRVGDHDISKERDCNKGEGGLDIECAEKYQDFGIESSHYHPRYSRSGLKNDIALIRLDNDADFRPASVRPICLPIGSAATIRSKKVAVTGWGVTERGSRSTDLLQVFIEVIPNEQCATAYRNNATIGPAQLCAGGTASMDACVGDSGGPLQAPALYGNQTKFVQYGLVSFGPSHCGVEGYPSVYTKLSHYLDWVLNTMRE